MPGNALFWRVIVIGLIASTIANLFLMFDLVTLWIFPFIPRYSLFQFLFSYQDLGFVRRAFLGSLLDLPNDAGFVWQIYVFAIGQYAALLVAMAYWIQRHGDPGFAWIVVLSPATFLQFGYDFARLDAFFVLLTAANLMIHSRWPVLFLPIMVLIHEGAIIMFAPLIVMAHIYRFNFTPQLIFSTLTAVGIVIFFALDTQVMEARTYEIYTALPETTDILWRSFAENRVIVLEHYAETWITMQHVPFFFYVHVLAALYIILMMLYVGSWLTPGFWRLILVAACMTPLLLTPIGIDIGRWGALSVLNLFILHLAWARWNPPAEQPITTLSTFRFTMLWVLFALGPFAFGRPFPFARRAFYHLYYWVN